MFLIFCYTNDTFMKKSDMFFNKSVVNGNIQLHIYVKFIFIYEATSKDQEFKFPFEVKYESQIYYVRKLRY